MKVGRHLLLAAGVASVAYLVATTGVERLLGPVRTLSWRIAVFIALPYALVAFLHTVAWRLIPGALGVLEGGYMLVFSAFGLGGGLGLSFTLIRRLRMLAWSAAGLIVLALLNAAPEPVSVGAPEA